MVLTHRTTERSGIPLISSILATLGCKVLHESRHTRITGNNQHQSPYSAGVDLSAERSEDGAGGWYTALSGGATGQNHCSNHSGMDTGADTFVRSTQKAIAL